MAFTIAKEAAPLARDAHGVVRIGGTRVTLDSVVGAFLEGASAEEIVAQYPALDLADAYAAIGYYLRHQAEVDSYLREAERQEQKARERAERRWPPNGIRARLLARRARSK
jgi:uncharacterized protein (DUF433 family)